MKIAHLADLHCCRENAAEALASLHFFADYIKKTPVDIVCIAGDIWHASMLNTEASEFNRFVDAIRDIANIAPVAMIYGTPTHDTDGSLEIFRKITCEHGITVLDPGQAYFLVAGQIHSEKVANAVFDKQNRTALILGIPEPRKKYLLANQTTGKDESEETIREAMHKLCYLLAAKRKDYDSMPCIVLYHGDVAGCSLQNDQTIERGTGISITIDDLNDIGADYYALGHIHKPQQVGTLPAYYAGSIYPKNFGETHKAGFNIVQPSPYLDYTGKATEGSATVARVDFPHPQNKKIETQLTGNFKHGDHVTFNETVAIKGKKVWHEITCTKEQRAFIDMNKELLTLFDLGAVEGSRVTLCDIPTETVRAAEITAVNTPTQKYEIWAQNSDMEVTPPILEKVKLLETEILKKTDRTAGEWEFISLKLRGAIGIKKRLGKDEVMLDMRNYDNGLIALVGENGRGKTTLVENCHPYPQLFTRPGKLQKHFCLRDSFREVIFEDRSQNGAGHFIKFLIQIDGQNKSGSCKYFIFDATSARSVDTIDNWIPRPGVDGTLKPYEEEVNNIFGPVELYLRTAFTTQRPTKDLPDLTDATAGEKKTLFVELAGIEYLQLFSEAGIDRAKQETAKIHDAEIKKQMLENSVAIKENNANVLEKLESDLRNETMNLESVIELGKIAKTEMEKAQELFKAEELRAQKEIEARKNVDQVLAEIKALEADIKIYEETSKNKAVYERGIQEYETVQKTVEAETRKKQKHLEANMEKQQAYLNLKSAHDARMKSLDEQYGIQCDTKNNVERQILEIENGIKLLERDAEEIKENCPTCGQILPEAKLTELRTKRDTALGKIAAKNKELAELGDRLSDLSVDLDNLNNEIGDLGLDEPTPVKLDTFDETTLKVATSTLNGIQIGHLRASLEKANESKTRLEGIRMQLIDKQKLLAERSKLVLEITAGIDQTTFGRLQRELQTATTKHSELTETYSEIKSQVARLESSIEATKRTLAEIEAQEKELSILKYDIEKFKLEENDWNLISKAFGKDGIQALELDALAPGISDTANKILESAYGDRFKISIETTRIGGAGKKTKQIEDFMIKVIDSEDGEAVNLEDKSGGEAVWIKRAIYDAFSVIRKRNTNFVFLSCFQDEADGALDSKAKTAYCRMLEAAHSESKLRHTIIITHSDEVKAMIDQKIDMEALASKVAA